MSRIDELIGRLCPDGVQYEKLGEVTQIVRGRRVVRKNLDECEGFPVYQNSLKPLGFYSQANRPGGTTFVICAGAAGDVGYSSEDFWSADDCFCPESNDVVDGRYLYHVIMSMQPRLKAQVRKASIPRLSPRAIESLRIPVPPMEVQQEIVRVLDSFAELEARQSQFDYYVELLASCRDYPTKTIGHLCDVYTGGEAPVDCIKGNVSDDDHPYAVWANGRDVYGFAADYRIGKDAVCISSIGANTGAIFYHEANFTPIIRLKVLVPKTNEVLTRFLYYVMLTVKFGRKSGSVPNINASDVKRIEVPIPPLDVQREVIAKLDAFDNLVNGITDGIPAEIEARRKQYACYRDMLLSFRKKVA